MTICIRLPGSLADEIYLDLLRPHAFAGERVGFMFGKLAKTDQPLILISSYHPVADKNYVHRRRVAACINGIAIREAMQHALAESLGVFHVHLHGHSGKPVFSGIDKLETSRLIPSFQAVAPNVPHGAIIFSKDSCAVMVWMPGMTKPITQARVSLISWPMKFIGDSYEQR